MAIPCWPLLNPARFRPEIPVSPTHPPSSHMLSKDTAICIFWMNWVLALLVASLESLVCVKLSWAHRLGCVQGHPGTRGTWLS
jgi:hypothetical protein